jgi:adenylate cyclase
MANGRDERRLAVGYSKLMEADESGTIAQLKSRRKELIDPKIEEYDGRIVMATGDGLLLESPSVIDAVQISFHSP